MPEAPTPAAPRRAPFMANGLSCDPRAPAAVRTATNRVTSPVAPGLSWKTFAHYNCNGGDVIIRE